MKLSEQYGNILASGVIENISFTEIKTDRDFQDPSDNLYYPIYTKTIDFGALPNTGSKEVAHSISNIDIFVKIYGRMNNGISFLPLPQPSTTSNYSVFIVANATTVRLTTGFDYSTFYGSVALEYTKTTDTGTTNPRNTKLLGGVQEKNLLSVTFSENTSIANGYTTPVLFDNIEWDIYNAYSNGIWTAPEDMTIRIIFSINILSGASMQLDGKIVKDSSYIAEDTNNAIYPAILCVRITKVTTGQTITTRCWCGGTSRTIKASSSFLQIAKI